MTTVIKMLDTNGDFHELATYSLEQKEALIAFYMQEEKRNLNTSRYPKEISAIRQLPSGRYSYERNNGDVIYATSE